MSEYEIIINDIVDAQNKGLNLIKDKNHDYTGADDDFFKNFKESAVTSGVEVERGILVRIADKLSRVKNLIGKRGIVKDESIEDSLLDAANYLLILRAYLRHGKK